MRKVEFSFLRCGTPVLNDLIEWSIYRISCDGLISLKLDNLPLDFKLEADMIRQLVVKTTSKDAQGGFETLEFTNSDDS